MVVLLNFDKLPFNQKQKWIERQEVERCPGKLQCLVLEDWCCLDLLLRSIHSLWLTRWLMTTVKLDYEEGTYGEGSWFGLLWWGMNSSSIIKSDLINSGLVIWITMKLVRQSTKLILFWYIRVYCLLWKWDVNHCAPEPITLQ